jgi:nucleoid DNA-binding protein
MKDINNISRRDLWKYVNKKLNKSLHFYHIGSVITILIDEMIKDLKNGNKIKIFNFGILSLEETKPRKYHDVRYNKIMLSSGARILKFSLAPLIRKKLCNSLDIDKTFKDD